jgi:hypothetical protein
MIYARALIFCSLGMALALPLRGFAGALSDAGPLFDEFDLTLDAGRRTEAAGPLFYSQHRDLERIWAVPPLLSYTHDPATESTEFDFLYPIFTYDKFGDQYRWQLCQLLSLAGGATQNETVRDRFTLFPLYFQQRSTDPTQNYTAFVPFYGHILHRLFRDEVYFIMMPIYVQSRKKDVVTDNYVYPLFHLRKGNGLSGWQFWPIVGHEHKNVTTRTNSFNEIETIGAHDRQFVLWPIYSQEYSALGTDNPQLIRSVLPFYSIQRSPARDSTTVLWPFFARIDDREKNYVEWQTPWPLVEMARGEGKHTTRVWPFYSHATNNILESDFIMWPIYKYNRAHADPLDRRRARIVFWLYSDTVVKNTETGGTSRRTDVLPFFTHRRDFNGNTRLQCLAILEPFLPGSKSIERDYSQVWSLWVSEHNAKTGASSQSLLWNLYRHEKTAASTKWSALFGLFHYQSNEHGKRLRLFYVPFGGGGGKEG